MLNSSTAPVSCRPLVLLATLPTLITPTSITSSNHSNRSISSDSSISSIPAVFIHRKVTLHSTRSRSSSRRQCITCMEG